MLIFCFFNLHFYDIAFCLMIIFMHVFLQKEEIVKTILLTVSIGLVSSISYASVAPASKTIELEPTVDHSGPNYMARAEKPVKKLYMMTWSSDEKYNHLSALNLKNGQVVKVADTNGGSSIEVVDETIFVSASSNTAQGIWTINTNGSEESLYNYVPMAGRLPIAVDQDTSEVYVGSNVNDSVLKIIHGNGDDDYPEEGEDYEFILDPIAEGCYAGCEPGAMFVDEDNQRLYLAYGLGEDAKIISSTLGEPSDVEREEEVTVGNGFINDTHDSIKQMVVDPKTKNIYFSNDNFIYKAKVNNGRVKIKTLRTAPDNLDFGILGMTVDFEDNKIYWSEDYNIYSSNLQGNDIELVLEHNMVPLDLSMGK